MSDKIVSQNLHKELTSPVRKHEIEPVTRYVTNFNYVRNCPESQTHNRVAVSLPRVRFIETHK